jgi:hypothetical protein
LLEHREHRIRPGRDEKILLNWNALVISGLTRAGLALDRSDYLARAESSLTVLLDRLDGGGFLYHNYKDGKVGAKAFLDDYAYTITALLDVYQINFSGEHIDRAQQYLDYLRKNFRSDSDQLFYFSEAVDDLPLRRAEVYDNALPAGNSELVHNLLRMSHLTGLPVYRSEAITLIRPLVNALEKYGTSFGNWARALLYVVYPGHEIAVTGPTARAMARPLIAELRPNTPVMAADTETSARFPLLAERYDANKTRIFICRDFVCALPVTSLSEARKQLAPGLSNPA